MSAIDTGTARATEPAILDVQMARKTPPVAAILKKLDQDYGKSPYTLARDVFRHWWSERYVMPDEYFKFRLYDDAEIAAAAKREFIGMFARRRIVQAINFETAFEAVTDNKLITEAVLRNFGFPVVRTRALCHPTMDIPSLTAITSRDGLENYLRDSTNYPLFGKPINGQNSLGAVGLDSFDPDADSIRLLNGNMVAVPALAAEIFRTYKEGYLFQDRLESHPVVREIAGGAVSCIRFYTIVRAGRANVFRAVWKLPAGKAMADNFWRGNLLASLDMATGAVRRVVRGTGLSQAVLAAHPDTGRPFADLMVPDWPATKAMVLKAAATIPAVPLIGWDVAVTPTGGVIVESNSNPDTSLAQIADGRGVLDDELRALWAERTHLRETQRRRRKGVRLFTVSRWAANLSTVTNTKVRLDG